MRSETRNNPAFQWGAKRRIILVDNHSLVYTRTRCTFVVLSTATITVPFFAVRKVDVAFGRPDFHKDLREALLLNFEWIHWFVVRNGGAFAKRV
jgi:hypothetical protein